MKRRRPTTDRRLDPATLLALDYRRLAVRALLAATDRLAAIHGGGVSRRHLVNVLRASVALREDEAPLAGGLHGLFDHVRASWIERLLANAIEEGYIELDDDAPTARLALTAAGTRVARGQDTAPERLLPAAPRLGENEALEAALRDLRRDLARRDERAAYTVFPNESLAALAAAKPATLAELALVPGFGEARIRRYGRRVLATIRKSSV